MKMVLLLASLLFAVLPVLAEDAMMDGGRAPDRQHEVRILKTDSEPSDYAIRVVSPAKEAPVFTLSDVGGHLIYKVALERCRAFWNPSSQFVAVTDQGTRHSVELYLLAVLPSGVERLVVPDYVQNALGRVKATSVDFACVTTPERWQGDDLIMSLYFTANARRSYKCEIILHVSHEKHSYPRISLKSIGDVTEQEG